jgi:solute carrier family 25 phosphate transporter 23/24/25/41
MDSESGDVSLSAEDRPPNSMLHKPTSTPTNLPASTSNQSSLSNQLSTDKTTEYLDDEDPEEDQQSFLERHTSIRFLLAGGIAGAGPFTVDTFRHPRIQTLAQFHGRVQHRSIV